MRNYKQVNTNTVVATKPVLCLLLGPTNTRNYKHANKNTMVSATLPVFAYSIFWNLRSDNPVKKEKRL